MWREHLAANQKGASVRFGRAATKDCIAIPCSLLYKVAMHENRVYMQVSHSPVDCTDLENRHSQKESWERSSPPAPISWQQKQPSGHNHWAVKITRWCDSSAEPSVRARRYCKCHQRHQENLSLNASSKHLQSARDARIMSVIEELVCLVRVKLAKVYHVVM